MSSSTSYKFKKTIAVLLVKDSIYRKLHKLFVAISYILVRIKNILYSDNSSNNPWQKPASQKEDGKKHQSNQQPNQQNQGNKTNNNTSNNSNNGNKNSLDRFIDNMFENPKFAVITILTTLITFWLFSGFYKVNADENAAVFYFGKFSNVTTPGLNYHLPYPFGKAIKQSVTNVKTEEFGFSSKSKRNVDKKIFDAESLMLTGDENIVDIEFQVQWQIVDIKKFILNVYDPNNTIRNSAESSMREIIAKTPIVFALSDGKKQIAEDAKKLLQETLDYYQMGVKINLVQLHQVDPPSQVISSFRDVQTAKADKEKEINQAQAYANDIVPRARGEASQVVEDAEAYKSRIVADASGESERFISIYNQYKNAKQITKSRIYLETMEEVYGNTDKIIIDSKIGKSALFYLPNSFGNNQNFTPIPNELTQAKTNPNTQ
jgi:membrane protease subunit HflK